MRWLEVRRHSLTKKGDACGSGSHLSADGVALARAVGETLGPMSRVVTSESPRAIETAVAMGYAVDETTDLPSGYVPGVVDHHDQWSWPRPYDAYARLLGESETLADVAAYHVTLWRRVLAEVPDGTGVLIVSHGGSIEPVLVAAVPDANRSHWGPALAHCDGARLAFDGERFVEAHIRRAADRRRDS